MSLQRSFAIAGRDVPRLIDHAAKGLPLFDDPDVVVQAIAVELVGRDFDAASLACLAAHAIVEAAKARAEPFPAGRRYLTREVLDDIADDERHVRSEDVCDG